MSERKTITSTDSVHIGDDEAKGLRRRADAGRADVDVFVRRHGRDRRPHRGPSPNGERGEYGRYGNPTVRAVEQRLAALEGTEDAALFSSGMGAVTTSTLALAKGGAARRSLPGLLPDDARVRDGRARAVRGDPHAARRPGTSRPCPTPSARRRASC